MSRTAMLLLTFFTVTLSAGCGSQNACERIDDSMEAMADRLQTCSSDKDPFDLAVCEQNLSSCTDEQASLAADYLACALGKATCENLGDSSYNEEVARCARQHEGVDIGCLGALLNK